jgi:hypothetical protein
MTSAWPVTEVVAELYGAWIQQQPGIRPCFSGGRWTEAAYSEHLSSLLGPWESSIQVWLCAHGLTKSHSENLGSLTPNFAAHFHLFYVFGCYTNCDGCSLCAHAEGRMMKP